MTAQAQLNIRLAIEKRLVTATVDALLSAGYRINIDNGGDCPELRHASTDRSEILANLFACDEESLLIFKGAKGSPEYRKSWISFVYGNDGTDVISDYTTDLADVLAPVFALADKIELGN